MGPQVPPRTGSRPCDGAHTPVRVSQPRGPDRLRGHDEHGADLGTHHRRQQGTWPGDGPAARGTGLDGLSRLARRGPRAGGRRQAGRRWRERGDGPAGRDLGRVGGRGRTTRPRAHRTAGRTRQQRRSAGQGDRARRRDGRRHPLRLRHQCVRPDQGHAGVPPPASGGGEPAGGDGVERRMVPSRP